MMTRTSAPNPVICIALCLIAIPCAEVASAQGLPPPPALKQSPWNGDWVLSPSRNSAQIKAAAAEGYRFRLERDGKISWEIPSLHEVVEGRINGEPMAIHRLRPVNLTLAVTADGPRVLLYKVARAGRLEGEGRMTLVDQGAAWVDISQPAGRPDLASAIIYVRPGVERPGTGRPGAEAK